MKFFKKVLSTVLAASLLMGSIAVDTAMVSAAPTKSGGWNETLYAEWADSNPDAAKVAYRVSGTSAYTELTGDDAKYLIRPASASGYGRVDIPGLAAGRYDIKITASDGTEHTRNNIQVYAYDRSGYAHWTPAGAETYTEGVGAYKDDGTLKDNAIVIYVTDENKDTVTIPGYEDTVWSYTPSKDPAYTRTSEGIGNILNNNYKFIDEVTKTHPLVVRLIGKVNVPKNLTPYNVKDPILGGAKGDNGNLAIMKWGRNVTIEGIGDDAEMYGWGFTVSKTDTHPADSGRNVEVRNLTLRNYTEDGLGFQGEGSAFVERVWVHNNTFYPGYCANPAESDKGEGDGSCDFKRGMYYTMSYNHFINCHKTNLLGSGGSDDQWFMTAHHNWYENVGSRQPLAANGNVHVYNTYFQNGDTTVDTRNYNSTFLEANYYENCKSRFKSRNNTCFAKSYNEAETGSGKLENKGTYTVVTDRTQSVIKDNGYSFPDGSSMADFDTNSDKFYYDTVNKKTNVEVMNEAADVPEYVKTYAGPLHAFPVTESGTINITVKTADGTPVTDAVVSANGLNFRHTGNGVYTATAEIGAEYHIIVSKEGYSNVEITPEVITEDGQVATGEATLQVDHNGYAVVSLTGGSANEPVIGATVTLNNGTALVDQKDGTYKSANEIATGNYTATITNTGDYIAPSAAQTVVVKTTNAPTEIHLDKYTGAVSVTVKKADDETAELDLSKAAVYVGSTPLTNSGSGVFTGSVEVGTPQLVSVSVPGWNVDSVTPAQLTASRTGTASAEVILRSRGELFTWNYTTGENKDDFFVFGNALAAWSSAKNNPQTYEGEELTAAIKVQSSFSATFEAPADGTLILVMENAGKSNSTIEINGTDYPVVTGVNKFSVPAGTVTIKKGKNETHLYLMQYGVGDITPGTGGTTPTPPGGDTSTTENSTEVTTAAPVDSDPVDKGDPITNSGEDSGKVSVVYDEPTDSYILKDTSSTLAAKLNIPLKETIKSGKVVVRGTATPTKESGSWALVSITGPADANGEYPEIAALTSNGSKMITLRVNADKTSGYSASSDKIVANKKYNYEFIIDLDNASVTLTVNGTTYVNAVPINVTEIGGFAAITAVSDTSRNLTVSNPYIGIVQDAPPKPEGLYDEIMWPVEESVLAGTDRGLTYPENYGSTEDEKARTFTDSDGKSYDMSFFLQGRNNPLGKDGATNPMSPTNDGIPVSGAFVKYDATSNGVFTAAAKTNAGKVTYVIDDTGAVLRKIDNTGADTTYDIIRFNVKEGHSYYIYSASSRICFYYLGYTSGISVEDPTIAETSSETTTASTETSSETTTASTETSSETTTTTTTLPPVTVDTYGDADANNEVQINDVVQLLNYALKGVINQIGGGVVTPDTVGTVIEKLDVSADGKLDSADVAVLLQKILNSNYKMPVEKKG